MTVPPGWPSETVSVDVVRAGARERVGRVGRWSVRGAVAEVPVVGEGVAGIDDRTSRGR